MASVSNSERAETASTKKARISAQRKPASTMKRKEIMARHRAKYLTESLLDDTTAGEYPTPIRRPSIFLASRDSAWKARRNEVEANTEPAVKGSSKTLFGSCNMIILEN